MMYEYSHGGNAVFEQGNENIIDLSANINPLGLPKNVVEVIAREIPNIKGYPDNISTVLCKKTAEFEGVNPDWLIFGNGASDIIFRLPRAVKANKVLLCAPTFADYERSARSYGAQVCLYLMSKDNGFVLDGSFIKAVQSEKPKLVYVCNPNNPTGKITKAGVIKELLDCCMQIGAWVAIDECFMDFTEQAKTHTSKVFLSEYSNLIIIKSFTKIFAMPGIRLGYALCSDKAVIESLYSHGADWSVSNLAQAAGLAALEKAEDFIEQTIKFVTVQRSKLENEIEKLGCKVFTSAANYVFFQSTRPFNICEKLDEKRIRIRSCGNYHGLDNTYCRVAVSTAENNDKLLAAIGSIFDDEQSY